MTGQGFDPMASLGSYLEAELSVLGTGLGCAVDHVRSERPQCEQDGVEGISCQTCVTTRWTSKARSGDTENLPLFL